MAMQKCLAELQQTLSEPASPTDEPEAEQAPAAVQAAAATGGIVLSRRMLPEIEQQPLGGTFCACSQ